MPGAKDLEAALNRLTPAEIIARRAMLTNSLAGFHNYEEEHNLLVPQGLRTPDSIMSSESFSMNTSARQCHWRLPEKLQIIKPMEGSQTLKHWNKLATPTLSGLLEQRPGVAIRGSKGLDDLGLLTYSLSDCEEDYNPGHPGKRFQSSSCIFTYTNSTVMHPDDGTSTIDSMSRSSSHVASHITSKCVSNQSSTNITPRTLSRRNSCSTFSVNTGLASMLNERGIKAVTPSALNTPCGINYSPTSTPCNSPEGSSPMRHLSPEPKSFSGLLTSGAELIRNKIIGNSFETKHKKLRQGNTIILSRLEKRALKSINILEKVEHLGLDKITPPSSNIISTMQPLNNQLYSSRTSSPMAQLTSLKKINTSDFDELSISKNNNIKDVLNKVWSTEFKDLHDNSDISHTLFDPSSENHNPLLNESSINKRLKQMQRQKSRRHVKSGSNLQRQDLGTVGTGSNNSYQNNSPNKIDAHSIGFIGTISSLLFGRKGGLF